MIAHSSHLNSQTSSKMHLQQISLSDEPTKGFLGEFSFISVVLSLFTQK